MTYHFDVILDAYTLDDVPDEVCDELFEAGCDDATPFSSEGVTRLGFARDATSLEAAIRSALRDVAAGLKAAGSPMKVLRVEIEPSAIAVTVPE